MLLWFIIGVIFLIIEILTFGLISIWFAFGAFLTMFFYTLSHTNQFYIFVLTSFLCLIFIRRFAVKNFKNSSKELNRINGKVVKIEKIQVRGSSIFYSVYLDSKTWECISEYTFNIGDEAIVQKVVGNKLVLIKKS